MGIYSMGASSNADKETRELKLKSYLNQASTSEYNSLTALQTAGVYSWSTFRKYLRDIQTKFFDSLTEQGKANFKIADRESELLLKANNKAKRRKR